MWFSASIVVSRDLFGDVDFLYFVLNARDVVDGYGAERLDRFVYFPGAYSYWQTMIRLFGSDLVSLQLAAAWTVVAMGVGTGALAGVMLNSVAAGAWAANLCWYLVGVHNGFEGTLEPVVMLPAMWGLALWFVAASQGRTAVASLLLAMTIGSVVFVKQQGVLTATGLAVVGVIFHWQGRDRAGSVRLGHIVVITVGSVVWFALCSVVAGVTPGDIARGVNFVFDYEPRAGSVGEVARRFDLLGVAWVGLAVPLIVAARFCWRERTWEPFQVAVAMLTLSALLGVAQFWKRGYLHYTHLILPQVAVLAVVGAAIAWRQWRAHPDSRTARVTMLGIGAATLVSFVSSPVPAHIGLVDRGYRFRAAVPAELCSLVAPSDSILVVPAAYNEVHLRCGTRAGKKPGGYGWYLTDETPQDVLANLNLGFEYVLFIRRNAPPWDTFVSGLVSSGRCVSVQTWGSSVLLRCANVAGAAPGEGNP